MKKLFLFIALVLCSSVGYATDSTATDSTDLTSMVDKASSSVSTTLNTVDTSSLAREIYNDLTAGITALAGALKVGATHVYEVLVKQQYVYSIIYLMIYIILLITIFMMYRITKKTYHSHLTLCGYKEGDSYNTPDLGDSAKGVLSVVLSILTIAISVTFIVMFCITIELVITGFVNPEYGAMKDIVNFTK